MKKVSSFAMMVLVVLSFSSAAFAQQSGAQLLMASSRRANSQKNSADSTIAAAATANPSAMSFTRDKKGGIDSYVATNGRTYKIGDTITLLQPQRIDGNFKYVLTSFSKKHRNDNGDPLEAKWKGQKFVIAAMDNSHPRTESELLPNGMYFFINIKGMFGGLYQINAESALTQKEIQ